MPEGPRAPPRAGAGRGARPDDRENSYTGLPPPRRRLPRMYQNYESVVSPKSCPHTSPPTQQKRNSVHGRRAETWSRAAQQRKAATRCAFARGAVTAHHLFQRTRAASIELKQSSAASLTARRATRRRCAPVVAAAPAPINAPHPGVDAPRPSGDLARCTAPCTPRPTSSTALC